MKTFSLNFFSWEEYRQCLNETWQKFELECGGSRYDKREQKLWLITFKKIREMVLSLEEKKNLNLQDVLGLKEFIFQKLEEHFYRSNINNPIACIFIQDLKEKTLLEIHTKYFSLIDSPLLQCKDLSFVQDLAKIFTSEKAVKWMEIEANAIKKQILEEQSAPKPTNRNEFLRLLVYLEQLKRVQSSTFNCFVLNVQEFESFLMKLINQLDKNSIRAQFLIKNGIHYTAVDSELSLLRKEAFIIDAAADMKYESVQHILKKCQFTVIYQVGHQRKIIIKSEEYSNETTQNSTYDLFHKREALKKYVVYLDSDHKSVQQPLLKQEVIEIHSIQSDFYNCAVYGFNQLVHTSKDEKLFENLAHINNQDELNGAKLIYWFQLPP